MQRWWKANRPHTHVFYEVQGHEDTPMIVALWGATKEHGPDIGQ
jgi:hypothetical protein